MATVADQIAALEALLATGADSVTVDGITTHFDLPTARQRLRELYRQRDGVPLGRRIRMSGGYDTY